MESFFYWMFYNSAFFKRFWFISVLYCTCLQSTFKPNERKNTKQLHCQRKNHANSALQISSHVTIISFFTLTYTSWFRGAHKVFPSQSHTIWSPHQWTPVIFSKKHLHVIITCLPELLSCFMSRLCFWRSWILFIFFMYLCHFLAQCLVIA